VVGERCCYVRSGGSGEQVESSNSRAALSGDLARTLELFKDFKGLVTVAMR
jgi:hypothetical protein